MTVRFRMTLTRLRAYEAQAIVSSTTGGGFDYSYADILGQLPSSWLCGIAANGDVIEPPCSAGHQAALDWITNYFFPGDGEWQPSSAWCQQTRTFRNLYCNDRPPWDHIGNEIDPVTSPNLCPR